MPKSARPAGAGAAAFAVAAVLLAFPTAGYTRASQKLAFTGTIAFLRSPAGTPFDFSTGPSLYVVNADGSGLRRLTPRGTPILTYAWSPDGELIAYIDARRLSLWLVRPDGSGPRRLLLPSSKLSSVGLSWAPDGTKIAITSPGPDANLRTASRGKLALYVVPVGGGRPARLPSGGHVGGGVAWSPRGDEIAYDGDGGVAVIRPDGTGRRRIALGGGVQWSADGEQLAFGVAIHLRSGVTDRYRAFGVADADGQNFHVVTTHAYNEYGVAWSPSGRRILYGRADGQGIYVIGSDGRNNRRVTRDSPPGAGWGALAWSPDGRSIVYTTGGTDDTDLYLIDVNGRGKFRLTGTPDTDIAPSWVAP
jgi:Tol biopolymer transport system component